MKLQKTASLALCASLVISLLASCGEKPATSKTESSTPATTSSKVDTSKAEEKTYELKLIAPVNGPVDAGNDLEAYMNTLVPGLTVTVEGLEIGSYWDLLNPRLASGEIPDAFHCHNETMYANYIAQNVLAGLEADVIKTNMPKYVAATVDYGAEVWSMVLNKGLIYGLPAADEEQTHPFTNAWRADWLKAVGIEKVPTTLDEYEEAMTLFTTKDPDGNGAADTYGTTMRGKDATPNLFPSLFGAYGIYPSMWNVSADGSLKYGITDPRGKDALVKLNSWFKKGIIDPEFTAVDGTARTDKWSNSIIGLMSDSTYYEVNPGKTPYDNLKALTPNAEIVRGPAPKGPNGDYGYMNWSKLTNKIVFGKPLGEDPVKTEKFLQLWEKVNTDPDIYNRVRFGEEGVNWERQEDGSVINIPPFNDPANNGKLGINAFNNGCTIPTPAVRAQIAPKNAPEQYKYAIEGTLKNGEHYLSYLGKFADGTADTAYKMEADIIYKKNLIDFITGARSLDEYDAFVTEWNAAGGEAYTKAYNEIYKTVDAKMDEAKALFN